MEANPKGIVSLPALSHVGMVVRDMDAVMEFYSATFGIGPWKTGQREYTAITVRGKQYPARTRAAWASLGPVTLELFELQEGTTLHAEFLDKGREGLHHLGFRVSPQEKENIVAALADAGVGVAQRYDAAGMSHVFMDTEQPGGVFFEFNERPLNDI